MNNRVRNTEMFQVPIHPGAQINEGTLVAIEASSAYAPFDIKRVYYIYSVSDDSVRRGFHSHKILKQILICISGSVKILVESPYEIAEVLLDDPGKALYIGPMVWREMFEFSPDAVLLVLASEHYDSEDYINDKAQYIEDATVFFSGDNT